MEDRVERVHVDPHALAGLVEALFQHDGMSAEDAATVARVQLEADLRGTHSHGMRAVPMYLERIRRGIINPRPNVQVADLGVAALVDGDAGPGQVVASRAMEECLTRARRFRVGLALVRNSNHFGAAGYYAGMALREDLIGFATTNGNLVLAPWGGITPTVGNNPMAIAVPAGDEPPILLDVAMSVVAGGKVDLLAAEGEDLPPDWCLDAEGRPTENLAAALAGLGLPLGAPAAGHKGFGLAFAMEALAGALTGARFGREHTLEVEDGPIPWDEGHFFLAIDPSLAMPLATFKARVDQMIREVRETRPVPGGPPIHAPGELGWRRREQALREGIPLHGSIYQALRKCAEERRLLALVPKPLA
jgi:LDH2 family malate/lactate/ureidoglycolate dehydrogenase